MLLKQLFVLITLGTLVACAGTDEAREEGSSRRGDCIHQPSMLQRRAFGLRSSWAIGFVGSPTGRVCAGFGEVVFNDHMAGPVRIASIRQLTPEEEEGLLIQFGLKEPEVKRMPVPQEVEGADIEELDPDANE